MDDKDPFHVLALNVVLRALRDYVMPLEIPQASKARRNQIRQSALDWFKADEKRRGILSFNLCCDALDIEKDELLKLILEDEAKLAYNLTQLLSCNKQKRSYKKWIRKLVV